MIGRLLRSTPILAGTLLAGVVAGAQADESACAQARLLAETVFVSDAPRLYAPQQLSEHFAERWQLGALAVDISGGAPLYHGPAFGRQADPSGGYRYTALTGPDGVRLQVNQLHHGWQGDIYRVTLEGGAGPEGVLLERSWRPPLVFSRANGELWLVTVGEPYEVHAPWKVYTAESVSAVCELVFQSATGDLPLAVTRLTDLLSQALGSGEGEGTLQPTARIRLAAAHLQGNLQRRPWALDATAAYNSRAAVDAALLQWAQQNAAHADLLTSLMQHYGPAEQALADYYQHHFGVSAEFAQRMSSWALDLLYRVWFVFPKGAEESMQTSSSNPWPATPRPVSVVEHIAEDG